MQNNENQNPKKSTETEYIVLRMKYEDGIVRFPRIDKNDFETIKEYKEKYGAEEVSQEEKK